jgi:menaquinone-dependent protoporphyrinogen oxidase
MKTAIIYSSSHGTTEKAAHLLRENLVGEVELINLKKLPNPDMEEYESVIIGSSVHAGSIQGKVKNFIGKNLNVLLAKKIGLFLCCMHEGEEAKKQFEKGYPEELRDIAISNGLFGGEFIFSKMNFIERKIIKKISGVTSDVSKLDHDAIKKFADEINNKAIEV